MSDDEIIAAVKQSLKDWGLGDIYKALLLNPGDRIEPDTELDSEKAALRGAFVLGCSLLDAMSCYRFAQKSSQDNFKKFCENEGFMPGYNATGKTNDLYLSLRCGMLHNYQPGNIPKNTDTLYALTHDKDEKHLQQEDKTVWINLQNFIGDVHNAVDKFFSEAKVTGDTRTNTLKWAKLHGWFGITTATAAPAAPTLSTGALSTGTTLTSSSTLSESASGVVYYSP